MKTIMWAMPVYGNIHRLVYESHISAMGALTKNKDVRIEVVAVTNKMGLASAENEIVRASKKTKPDFIFWTEMDMILPTNCVVNLFESIEKQNVEIMSGVYFLRGSGQPCLFKRWDKKGENEYAHSPFLTFPKDRIFPCDCPGMGCVLMKSSVFDKINEPWFDDRENGCGTDIYFYTNAAKKGIQAWVDPRVICDQIDEDEPKRWGIEDYVKWIGDGDKKGGFVDSCAQTIN